MEALLLPLLLLACPVGMGLMMWFMARGHRGKGAAMTGAGRAGESDSSPMSLEVLREEHRRLGDEIERLQERSPADPEAVERR